MTGSPTEISISTTSLTHDTEQDGDQEIESILMLLEELMDSVRKGVETDCLETAISLLRALVRATLESGTHAEKSRLAIYHQLITALLVRYGLYDWIGDIDTCWKHLTKDVGVMKTFEFLRLHHNSDKNAIEGQVPAQLIKACRSSIDIAILNNVVCVATEALDSYKSSYSDDKLALQTAKLRILLGKALVMKYLNYGDIVQLDQATQCLLQQEITSLGDTSVASMFLISLQHIEWLHVVEYGDGEALLRLGDYWQREYVADKEARDLCETGTAMIEQGVDLQEGIALLTASLNCRVRPHPRCSHGLNEVAMTFISHCQRTGNWEKLDGAITLFREALDLEPPPHPNRSKSLTNLAASLCDSFIHKGAFEDLEESITLHREALDLRQPPHSDRLMSLTNLALSHSTRFKHRGSLEDLEECIKLYREALDLLQPPHPGRAISLRSLAMSLYDRFNHKGAFEDLEESITISREVLDLPRPTHLDRSTSLNDLGNFLLQRFEHKRAFEDLEESITLHREALDLLRPPHPDRSISLNSLASCLCKRFHHKGAFENLEESITLHREALDLRQRPHPDCSKSLNNLALSLSERFALIGALEDLDECITFYREALDLCQPPHPDHFKSLHNLANSLYERFRHKGAFEDLEESITLHRETVDLQPPHLDRLVLQRSLAHSLCDRFKHKGTLEDLEESITLQREALNLHQPPHPDRSMLLHDLAHSLLHRFRHKRAFGDLEDSIALNREALDLLRPPHPDRSTSLNSLAISLHDRFRHKGAFKDLEESITLNREALDLLQSPHPDRSISLNSLAASLRERFSHKGAFEDLEESIKLWRETLDLLRPPHPDHSMSLNNLALSLISRFEHKGIYSDIENAMQYFQEAADYPTGRLLSRLTFSRNWVISAQKHCPASTLDAYICSMELLPQLASLDLTLQQRQDVLQHGRDLAGNAAKCAIDADRIELAITFLSSGRSVFWSQALQLRTPVDVIMITHPAIAEKFITVSRQLENASYSQRVSGSSSSIVGETRKGTKMHSSLHKLTTQRQDIIEEIRGIHGYEDFLLPRSFESLHPAAENGPVILLNASKLGCDALVMHRGGHVEHIPLSDIHLEELELLKMLIHNLLRSGMRSIEISQDMVDTLRKWLGRDMVLDNLTESNEEIFRLTLRSIWLKIVQPVVKTLQMEKTDSPTRIWWCPTGPFSSLPIHAAGVYSAENKPHDCLFQYAVSSYITAPPDLLHSTPQVKQSFKVTAVIEPEAINHATALPFTVDELEKIGVHVPRQHLIARVGSKRTPNQIGDIVSSIQQSSFVHFGCHGMQSLKDPLESSLLLSGGRLTMSRLMKECRVPEGALAYLSACETAKGDEDRPDESLNLVATMMFAGFRSVVGTLWSILDCDAPIVADEFYRYLFRNGEEKLPDVTDAAYALHLATKKLRDGGRPFFSWVPYVHYGI